MHVLVNASSSLNSKRNIITKVDVISRDSQQPAGRQVTYIFCKKIRVVWVV